MMKVLCHNCGGFGFVTVRGAIADCYTKCSHCGGKGRIETHITNADHIRSMTDEELADLLEGELGNMLPGTALRWLREEAKV